MNSKEMALLAGKVMDEKKGENIVAIDMGEKSSFTDYFVIASCNNERQMDALETQVEKELEKEGFLPKNIEGKKESGWILMDYEDIVVNILTVEMREKYNIENVWGDCNVISICSEETL